MLTKILQRPRLAAYLEQSTRYIAYDAPMPASAGERPRHRYYTDPELGPEYERAMDELFSIYSASIPVVTDWAAREFPLAATTSRRALTSARSRAKALDLLRGLLPAASLSHMGIFASGQSYEQLIMHLLAHPLPEARSYGEMLLAEVQAVIPSFVARVPRPDRGGEWIDYLRERGRSRRALGSTARSRSRPRDTRDLGPSVTLTHVDGSEEDLLCALLFESAGRRSDADPRGAVASAERRGAGADAVRARRRARQPPPSSRPRLRGVALSV